MKKFLIIIIALGYLGFLYSAVTFVSLGKQQLSEVLIPLTILVAANLISARYLYNKADHNKVEWSLFGFLGNITAIIIFWSFKDVLINWKRGKRNFS